MTVNGVADLNGDGNLDLSAIEYITSQYASSSVILGHGDGSFSPFNGTLTNGVLVFSGTPIPRCTGKTIVGQSVIVHVSKNATVT